MRAARALIASISGMVARIRHSTVVGEGAYAQAQFGVEHNSAERARA
jgi:hypothetical protein